MGEYVAEVMERGQSPLHANREGEHIFHEGGAVESLSVDDQFFLLVLVEGKRHIRKAFELVGKEEGDIVFGLESRPLLQEVNNTRAVALMGKGNLVTLLLVFVGRRRAIAGGR